MRKIKSKIVLSVVILNLFYSLTLNAKTNLISEWKYNKDIILNESEERYNNIFPMPDVYKYSKTDLSDIRIVDQYTNFVPYYIKKSYSKKAKSIVKYGSKMINFQNTTWREIKYKFRSSSHKSINISDNSIISVYEFQVISVSNKTEGNKLSLLIKGEDYSRQIEVYGRNHNISWKRICFDTIYNFNKLKKTSIDFKSKYEYSFYRIEILNNKENIKIDKLYLIYDRSGIDYLHFERTIDLKFDILQKEGDTLIALLNPDHLKINKISLFAEGDFQRNYSVYHVKKNKTNFTGFSGKIYDFNFKDINVADTTVDFQESFLNYELIQIKIINRDDNPLKIAKIKFSYLIDNIIFKSKKNNKYKLYFGNPDAEHPSYDIVYYKKHIKDEDIKEAKLGELQDLHGEIIKPSWFGSKSFFNIMIIVLSLLLMIYLVIKLKAEKN